MGAATAYWLVEMHPGLKVTVAERDPSYATSSTALSVASVRSQFSTAINVKMSRFGVDFIRNFPERLGLDPAVANLGLKENGYLFVTSNPEKARLMEDLAEMQRGLGAATEILGPEALSERFPWMNTDDLVAGSFGPRDEGWFDNMGLVQGFREAARNRGATFVKDEVTALEVEGGRVTAAVLGQGGRIPCGAVVNAAGPRAAVVARMAGLDLPVEPRKRTVFVIDAPNARHPDAPLLIDHGFYLRPEHGQWITATVPQDDGPCDFNDFEPDLHLFEEVIWEQLWHRAPGFDAVKVIRHWVGHYEYNSLDQNAILGPHPDRPNLYFINGFSGHGLQQAPAAGRAIAEHLLTGGWRSIDMTDLSIDRVIAGRPFRELGVV
ncbi:FAD-binding oxidoreductase [Aliigemmobacter aestuarii]|uniref:FAD-binding oxidoreductase n=2 Tax=Aliigemmobacter aestuarii TaxID=1445661 RepID=A0A4S3MLT7_9RHOB|nr:FAD-binding oxidoreductase [Gemmobacter aestuarii]